MNLNIKDVNNLLKIKNAITSASNFKKAIHNAADQEDKANIQRQYKKHIQDKHLDITQATPDQIKGYMQTTMKLMSPNTPSEEIEKLDFLDDVANHIHEDMQVAPTEVSMETALQKAATYLPEGVKLGDVEMRDAMELASTILASHEEFRPITGAKHES